MAGFSTPAAGTFGNAGRNTVIGPGTENMNLSLTRNIPFGGTRGMSVQLQANNVFNTIQWGSIDTVLNWPVANPFWMIEVTPKPPPNCVD